MTENFNHQLNDSNSFGNDIKSIFIKDYKFIIFAFIFAITTHILLWIAYPLHWGPDGPNYIYYYLDIFNKNPLFPMILTYRTPVAPLFYGFLLELGGSIAVSMVIEVLSLLLIPAVYLLSLSWGKYSARVATILFIAFLPYQIQFHQISSDALFSWFVLIFFLSLKYAIAHKNIYSWLISGIIASLTILTRPSGLVIVIIPVVLFFLNLKFKKILKLAGVFLLCIIVFLGSFIIFKGVRLNDYGLSRGSNYTAFMRIYTLQESLWSPDNGPESKKLVSIVEEKLLTTDLYKKYDIDIKKVLAHQPNRRILGDIIVTVDRVEGWNTEYELLKKVAYESIKASSFSFLEHYLRDILLLITINQDVPEAPGINDTKIYLNDINSYTEEDLPKPTEGELIPFSNTWWMLSRPDGSLPSTLQLSNFNERYEAIVSDIDNPGGSEKLVKLVNRLWDTINIPISYFWVFGIFAIIFSKKLNRILLITIIIFSLIIIVGTLYAAHVYTRYRLPLDPLLMIAGVAGFFSIIERIHQKNQNN